MIRYIKHTILLLSILGTGTMYCSTITKNDTEDKINLILLEWSHEVSEITTHYEGIRNDLYNKLHQITLSQKKVPSIDKQVALLILKDQLQEQLKTNNLSEISDVSKIRYLKGLQIIKLLYEKMLSLDHHFASVSTFHEIKKIANPNNYPEFNNIKEVIGTKADKKKGFDLTNILGNNIYASVAHSFISLFNNDSTSKAQKEESLKDVECILDFTLRMHNDLNTIYFETVFLQKSNENIMTELQQLFVDFTKPIKYKTPLKECRNNDDWDLSLIHI